MRAQLCPRQPVPPGARRPAPGTTPGRMPRSSCPGLGLVCIAPAVCSCCRGGVGQARSLRSPRGPSVGRCAGVMLPSPGGRGQPGPAAPPGPGHPLCGTPPLRDTPLGRNTLFCRDIPSAGTSHFAGTPALREHPCPGPGKRGSLGSGWPEGGLGTASGSRLRLRAASAGWVQAVQPP